MVASLAADSGNGCLKVRSSRTAWVMHTVVYLCDLLRELVVRDFKLRYKRRIG
jgi:hypothetical protein